MCLCVCVCVCASARGVKLLNSNGLEVGCMYFLFSDPFLAFGWIFCRSNSVCVCISKKQLSEVLNS